MKRTLAVATGMLRAVCILWIALMVVGTTVTLTMLYILLKGASCH